MEQFATAIIGALIAGSANVAKDSVRDAYSGLKKLLKTFAPRFDSEAINPVTTESKTEELTQRLRGLTDSELQELARELAPLVATIGGSNMEQVFNYSIKNIRAGENADLELCAKGDHNLEGVLAGKNIRIVTRSSGS
jgi:hypothetical protein